MMYKVWVQIEEIDEAKDHYVDSGLPYEAAKFNSREQAVRFVETKLIKAEPVTLALQKICQLGFQFLDSLPQTESTTELESRQCFRKMLNNTCRLNTAAGANDLSRNIVR